MFHKNDFVLLIWFSERERSVFSPICSFMKCVWNIIRAMSQFVNISREDQFREWLGSAILFPLPRSCFVLSYVSYFMFPREFSTGTSPLQALRGVRISYIHWYYFLIPADLGDTFFCQYSLNVTRYPVHATPAQFQTSSNVCSRDGLLGTSRRNWLYIFNFATLY